MVLQKRTIVSVGRRWPVFLDDDMIDWFLADPLAAAEFLRNNRVQVLEDGAKTETVCVMVLTRDSVPGLGLAC